MTDILTPGELADLKITVSQFSKISESQRLVGVIVRIEEDEKEFSDIIELPAGEKRKKIWFATQLVRQLKKEIKKFVKGRDQTIVGTQLGFDSDFWA